MSVPTEDLRAKIANFEEKAREWLRDQSKEVDSLARQHEVTVQEGNNEIYNLKAECELMRDEEQRQKELERELTAELARLNSEYDAIMSVKSSKPAERAQLREKITELDNITKQKLLELNDDKRVSTLRLEQLSSVAQLYSRTLGLDVTTSNGMLRIAMTDVHPLAPTATLSFLLHIDDAGRYRVYDCAPALPTLDELVEELRAGDDVTYFVHRMRRAFRAHLDKQLS